MTTSICMATYNGSNHLIKTLPLIISQMQINDELIIIDDASTDNTINIIQENSSPNIIIIQNKKNKGSAFSFFKAIKKATREIIVLADQDDLWNERKLTVIKNTFEYQKKNLLLVHNGTVNINGQNTKRELFDLTKPASGIIGNIYKNRCMGNCMAFSNSIANLIHPWFILKGSYHDHYISSQSLIFGFPLLFLPDKLICYIRHKENLSSIERRSPFQVFKDRILLISMIGINFPFIIYKKLFNNRR